jgi:hypothetical protein
MRTSIRLDFGKTGMKNPSRRTVFYIAVGTIILAARARADPLQSQESVSYQTMPSNGQQCSGCRNFIAGGACKIVAGTISPHGYCVAFEAN